MKQSLRSTEFRFKKTFIINKVNNFINIIFNKPSHKVNFA